VGGAGAGFANLYLNHPGSGFINPYLRRPHKSVKPQTGGNPDARRSKYTSAIVRSAEVQKLTPVRAMAHKYKSAAVLKLSVVV